MLGLMKTMVGGFVKNTFNRPLSSGQRVFVTMFGKIPDRIPITGGVTNINPFWVDKTKYDYYKLTHEPQLTYEYISDLMELLPEVDWWAEPWVGGLMLSEGAAECGTVFEFPKETFAYPVRYAINDANDLDTLKLQEGGYLGLYIETLAHIKDMFPHLMFPAVIPCPWTLGTFIRGADRLIEDFLIYKNYINTESAARRRKLEQRAAMRAIDPLFWEREMNAYLEICLEIRDRHKEAGTFGPGTIGYDLYASPPNLDVDSYSQYVLSYAEQVMKGIMMGMITWQPTSPDEIKEMRKYYKGIMVGNIGFEIDMLGHFNQEHEEATVDLAKEVKNPAYMMVAPDFIRDASQQAVAAWASNLCSMITEKQAPALLIFVGIPAHTPKENVRTVVDVVMEEGYYR